MSKNDSFLSGILPEIMIVTAIATFIFGLFALAPDREATAQAEDNIYAEE